MSTRQLPPRAAKLSALHISKPIVRPLGTKKASAPQPVIAPETPPEYDSSALSIGGEFSKYLQDSPSSSPLSSPPSSPGISPFSSPVKTRLGAIDIPPLESAATAASQPPRKKSKLEFPPGVTPFPNHPHPTPDECATVAALLTSVHGPAVRPENVPKPDNSVSGCGEVPSILDALLRTILSANTSNTNSARAFAGLCERFGVTEVEKDEEEVIKSEDIPEETALGKENETPNGAGEQKDRKRKAKNTASGSVNWEAVRNSKVEDIIAAIKSGGLANVKGKRIKTILDQVWEEGKERKMKIARDQALKAGDQSGDVKSEQESKGGNTGIEDDEDISELSLDYLHELPDIEVMEKLTSFDGVGPKTASCVLLFCLQRPSFAVDTHVFRLSKFLNWVPPARATRESTYAHLDTKIPNDLKYPLHCLLIRHGKMCKHCKAGPGPKSPTISLPSPSLIKKSNRKEKETTTEAKKKTKKVWIGTGMMKEIVVDVESDDEIAAIDKEEDKCVLEALVKRVRKQKS